MTSLWDSPNKTHPALWLLLSVSLLLNLNSRCLLRNQTHNNQNYTGQRFGFISVWLFLSLTFSVFSFLSSLCLSWSQWTAAPVGCRVRNYKWQTTDFRHTWVRVCETCVLLSSLSSLGDLAGLWEFVTRLLTAIQRLIYLKSLLHTVTQTHYRVKELNQITLWVNGLTSWLIVSHGLWTRVHWRKSNKNKNLQHTWYWIKLHYFLN